MSEYAFIYHGGNHPESESERAEVLQNWKLWMETLKDGTVDAGNPVGMSKTVMSDGSIIDNGGSNPTCGYSVFSAKDMDDALNKAKSCPHLNIGGSIEVAEVIHLEM
ncbi:MAG: hypothetical protein ACRBCI_11625 [Cellvibrionaceae bacterium]